MTYRTSSFEHEGHRLVYDEYGSGDSLVVYMHGLLLDSNLNRGIADALADRGNRVVLLDLLGHGRSGSLAHAAEYRIDSYAEQVIGLLDHLGVERAVLGGLSLGANVSLFAAVEHPERVQGLVLEMPVLEWAVPSAALAFVPMLLAAHYGRPIMRDLRCGEAPSKNPMGPVNALMHAGSLPPEVMAAILHGVLVGPVAPSLDQRSRLEAPTLVLAHSNDLIHPFSDAVNLVNQLPNARLERARSPVELRFSPERLTDCVVEFIDEVAGRTAAKPALKLAANNGSSGAEVS